MNFPELVIFVKRLLVNIVDVSEVEWTFRQNEFLQETWIELPVLADNEFSFFVAGLKILGVKTIIYTLTTPISRYTQIDVVERFDFPYIHVSLLHKPL